MRVYAHTHTELQTHLHAHSRNLCLHTFLHRRSQQDAPPTGLPLTHAYRCSDTSALRSPVPTPRPIPRLCPLEGPPWWGRDKPDSQPAAARSPGKLGEGSLLNLEGLLLWGNFLKEKKRGALAWCWRPGSEQGIRGSARIISLLSLTPQFIFPSPS